MAVQLDHLLVPCRDKLASARQLAGLPGVPWSETGVGPDEFDAILARIRAAGIACRSSMRGPVDFRVDMQHGGRIVYWNEPDGHQWEMLTVSYARRASRPGTSP